MNFYREAAKVLDDLGSQKHGSLKSLVFDTKAQRTPGNQKRLYALLSETLKSRPPKRTRLTSRQGNSRECHWVFAIIEDWAKGSLNIEITDFEAKISRSLALVLVHDLLSRGGIAAASGPVKEAVLRHKTRLKADYVRAQLSKHDNVKGDLQ